MKIISRLNFIFLFVLIGITIIYQSSANSAQSSSEQNNLSLSYSGEVSGKYEHISGTVGYSFPVDFKWKTSIQFDEPVEYSELKWASPWRFNKTIKVTFRPYGYENLVEEAVPAELVERSGVYGLKVTGELRTSNVWSSSLGFITFDPGALGKFEQWSFNMPGSPNWSEFIHRYDYLNEFTEEMKAKENIRFFDETEAKAIYKQGFKVRSLKVHSVRFDLSKVRKWYFDQNLQKRTNIYVVAIRDMFDRIEQDSPGSLQAEWKQLDKLNEQHPRESKAALKALFHAITAKKPQKKFIVSDAARLSLLFTSLNALGKLKNLYDLKGNIAAADQLHAAEVKRINTEKAQILALVNQRRPAQDSSEIVKAKDFLFTQMTDGSIVTVTKRNKHSDKGVISKYDVNGNQQWQLDFPPGNTVIHHVVKMPQGNFIVLGENYYSNEKTVPFLTQYDSAGIQLWNKDWQAPRYSEFFSKIKFKDMQVDPRGKIYVLTQEDTHFPRLRKFDQHGRLLWKQDLEYRQEFIKLQISDDHLLGFSFYKTGSGYSSWLVVTKVSAAGKIIRDTRYVKVKNYHRDIDSARVLANGNIALVGVNREFKNETMDYTFWLKILNNSGDVLVTKTISKSPKGGYVDLSIDGTINLMSHPYTHEGQNKGSVLYKFNMDGREVFRKDYPATKLVNIESTSDGGVLAILVTDSSHSLVTITKDGDIKN